MAPITIMAMKNRRSGGRRFVEPQDADQRDQHRASTRPDRIGDADRNRFEREPEQGKAGATQDEAQQEPARPRHGPLRVEADERGEKRRAGKRGGRDDPNLEGAVAELEQIDRQQQAYEAVANRAQATRGEQEARFRRGAERQDCKRWPHGATRVAQDHAIAPTARK